MGLFFAVRGDPMLRMRHERDSGSEELDPASGWKKLKADPVAEQSSSLRRKRKLSQVDGDWIPPMASVADTDAAGMLPYFTTQAVPSSANDNNDRDDLYEDGFRLTKRVSLDGPMILQLGGKGRDGGDGGGGGGGEEDNMAMDWEAGPGYYARATDEHD